MRELILRGDERSIRYAFNLSITKGRTSRDAAVRRMSGAAVLGGRDVLGGEMTFSGLDETVLSVGGMTGPAAYRAFSFGADELKAYVDFLTDNGAGVSPLSYGSAGDRPIGVVKFSSEMLDELGIW